MYVYRNFAMRNICEVLYPTLAWGEGLQVGIVLANPGGGGGGGGIC